LLKTLVLGLGNPILTDDGVGVRVAEAVRAALPIDSLIEVREVSLGGLALMETMVGYDRVILIDAWQSQNGQPGTIHRMTLDDLEAIIPTQHSASPHDTNLNTALRMGRRLGLLLPEKIIIYAVEVANITDFSEEPTSAVTQAIPKVTASVLAELG
jgi:hydrogenase maturation protease